MTTARIALPVAPTPPGPSRFPIVAVLAPVVLSVAIWLLTGSVFALVFAALGPVTAIASLVDQRWSGRRALRRELGRFRADADSTGAQIAKEHAHERAVLEERVPDGASIVSIPSPDRGRWRYRSGPLEVSLGRGRVPSSLAIDAVPRDADGDIQSRLRELAVSAESFDGPVVVDGFLGVGVCGPQRAVVGVLRGLVLQAARALPPAEWWMGASHSGAESEWLASLPHRRRELPGQPLLIGFGRHDSADAVAVFAGAPTEADLPASCRVVLSVASGGPGRVLEHPDRLERREVAPVFVSRQDAAAWARNAAEDARLAGLVDDSSVLPDAVALSSLLRDPEDSRHSLACDLGVGAGGRLAIDLVSDGPHAVVGGTTGSGKSELLISWVLAMAATHSPERLTVLLVDFKGGSAFTPLSGLPHTVGIITDLDGDHAERALESLKAELRYREREIARSGGRSIEETALPRLVIVVDEFAAMLAEHPDLHALFGDIAARGRSLGVHLVLCTQRPAAAVRDGVLANADLRISLRVNNPADSHAVVGVPDAAELPIEPRGRAVVRAGGEPRIVQVPLASAEDAGAVAARWAGSPAPRRPWCDPLPPKVDLARVGPVRGIPLGLLDLPDEQRQEGIGFEPAEDGHLLVLGSPRSGRSTVLAALTDRVAPSEPAGAWDALAGLVDALDRGPGRESSERTLVAIDDVDALVPRFSPEHRIAWIDLLARVLREGPSLGIAVVLSAQRMTGDLAAIAPLLPSRLLLRHATKQDWVLAGGDSGHAIIDAPPGAGRYRGRRIQVVHAAPVAPTADVDWDRLEPGRPIAVVTTRAAATAAALSRAGFSVIAPDAISHDGTVPTRTAVVADIDEWQSRWGALAGVRPTCEVLLDGCSPADVRAVTRSRLIPPPLPPVVNACWRLRPDGSLGRARFPSAETPAGGADQASAAAGSR